MEIADWAENIQQLKKQQPQFYIYCLEIFHGALHVIIRKVVFCRRFRFQF